MARITPEFMQRWLSAIEHAQTLCDELNALRTHVADGSDEQLFDRLDDAHDDACDVLKGLSAGFAHDMKITYHNNQ